MMGRLKVMKSYRYGCYFLKKENEEKHGKNFSVDK